MNRTSLFNYFNNIVPISIEYILFGCNVISDPRTGTCPPGGCKRGYRGIPAVQNAVLISMVTTVMNHVMDVYQTPVLENLVSAEILLDVILGGSLDMRSVIQVLLKVINACTN